MSSHLNETIENTLSSVQQQLNTQNDTGIGTTTLLSAMTGGVGSNNRPAGTNLATSNSTDSNSSSDSNSPPHVVRPAQIHQPPMSFQQNPQLPDRDSSNTTVSGLLMEASHQMPPPQPAMNRPKPPFNSNETSNSSDGSRLSVAVEPMNVEPNRADFAISAGTEPLMESNPPSFVSQNMSSDIFNNNPYLMAHGHTNPNHPGIRYIPKTGPGVTNLIPQQNQQQQQQQQQQANLQKTNSRVQNNYYYPGVNASGSTVNYVNPSFQSSLANSTQLGVGAHPGGVGVSSSASGLIGPAANINAPGPQTSTFEGNQNQFTQFLSEIETAILRSLQPIELNEFEEITVNGERGIWANRAEVTQWRGQIPIVEYPINEDPSPQVITKRTNQKLDYTQEIAIRYLRPPTPPAPGDIIIQQIEAQAYPPAPPIIIRQQPPRPRTPEPLVIREAPPPAPPPLGRKVITISGKRVPPPPRKVIIERLAPIPQKPQSVIIERWLPYSQVKRRVIFNKSTDKDPIVIKPKNIIVQWEAPQVQIKREFKYLGVIRANPEEYRSRYGSILVTPKELPPYVQEIPTPSDLVLAANYTPPEPFYELEGDLNAFQLFNLESVGLGEYRSYLQRMGVLSSTTSPDHLSSSQTTLPHGVGSQNGSFNNNHAASSSHVPVNGITSVNVGGMQATGGQFFVQPQQKPSTPLNATISSSQSGPGVNDLFDELAINESMDEIIQHIFRSIDVNNSGRIRIEDAERTFLRMNTRLDRRYGEADVHAFFNAVDLNRDRTIDYGEFRRAFLNFSN